MPKFDDTRSMELAIKFPMYKAKLDLNINKKPVSILDVNNPANQKIAEQKEYNIEKLKIKKNKIDTFKGMIQVRIKYNMALDKEVGLKMQEQSKA